MMAGSEADMIVDCSPISQACVKALTDKTEKKRKIAANEIAKITVDFCNSSNPTMISKMTNILGVRFCLSPNPNARKGGLLGLAAIAVGYKNCTVNELPTEMIEETVKPILTCLLDPDPQVRYYACESLYNVAKVAKEKILPFFESIFENISKITADPAVEVRGGVEHLDRLMKDLIIRQPASELEAFVPRLEEYIYTQNPFTRLFIVSWIRILDSQVDMIRYLPILLDGIFNCLYDSTEEVRACTLGLLAEFLNKIVVRPTDRVNISSFIGILLKHARNDTEDVVQYTAIAWLRQFISLMDETDLMNHCPGILSAIFPCLALQFNPGTSTRARLSPDQTVQPHISQSPSKSNTFEISSLVNSQLLEQVGFILEDRRNFKNSESNSNDLDPILEVLMKELQKHEYPVNKLAILHWLRRLKRAEPDLVFADTLEQKLFSIFLETLSDECDNVVKSALIVMTDLFCYRKSDSQQVVPTYSQEDVHVAPKETSEVDKKKTSQRVRISQSSNIPSSQINLTTDDASADQRDITNIGSLIQALCKLFRENETVFKIRGTFIVLELCNTIKPETVYRTFAEIIKNDKMSPKFAFDLVEKLNLILLTTPSLYQLRSRLGNDEDPEMIDLFTSLYYAWCYSPVAALTLCLLTNNHRHASEIVTALSQSDINLDTLNRIDWVVQLIESPVFVSLRMRLLDITINQYLLQSLYGLLMILPQSEAFRKLSIRLSQVCKFMSVQPHFRATSQTTSQGQLKPPGNKETKKTTSLDSLMRHYFTIQNLGCETTGCPGSHLQCQY